MGGAVFMSSTNIFTQRMEQLALSSRWAARMLGKLRKVIETHRERWLCENEGQWPDKFSLLNRHVRTGCEPPFIFND